MMGEIFALDSMLDVLWKGTVLIGVVLLFLGFRKTVSASFRSAILTITLGCVALLPLAGDLLPTFGISLLNASTLSGAASPADIPRSRIEPQEPIGTPAEETPEMSNVPGKKWSEWVGLVWWAGMLVVFAGFSTGWIAVFWIACHKRPIEEEILVKRMRQIAQRLNIRRDVRLYASQLVPAAITIGVFRPKVILPADATGLSAEHATVVFTHELAHIKRHDTLMNFLSQIIVGFFWFHPLVWLVYGKTRAERERACDDMVLRCGTKASSYAAFLMDLAAAWGARNRPAWRVVAVSQGSSLKDRLLCILDPSLERRQVSPGRIIFPGLGLFAMAAALSAFSIWMPENAFAPIKSRVPVVPEGHDNTPISSQTPTTQTENHDTIRSMLSDSSTDIREVGVHKIGELPWKDAVPLLELAITNDANRVRSIALDILIGNKKSPGAQVLLSQLAFNDPNTEFRVKAAQHLDPNHGKHKKPTEYDRYRKLLSKVEESKKIALIDQLCFRREPWAHQLVAEMTQDSDAGARLNAVAKLRFLDSRWMFYGLGFAVQDTDVKVRRVAAGLLAEHASTPKGRALLEKLLDDPDPEIRNMAFSVLSRH